MSTLLLRLAGPLQSWGYRSRYNDRDTGLEPSKSGVVGLLCCALGQDRAESPTRLAALRMHVRVDRQGTLLQDFHTAGGGVFRGSRNYFAPTSAGSKGKNPVVTQRHYLQDASFLVALEGDSDLLQTLARKLIDPEWPLALGRRSCPPSEPVLEAFCESDARTALLSHPLRLHPSRLPLRWNPGIQRYEPEVSKLPIRFVWECGPNDPGSELRRDVPLTWSDRLRREYGVRFVRSEIHQLTPEILTSPEPVRQEVVL